MVAKLSISRRDDSISERTKVSAGRSNSCNNLWWTKSAIVIYLGQDLHPGSSGTSRTRRYRTRPCTEVRILPFQSGCCHPDLPARGTSFLSIRSVSARTSHSLVGEWTGVTRYLFTPHQTVQDGVRTFLPVPDGTGQLPDNLCIISQIQEKIQFAKIYFTLWNSKAKFVKKTFLISKWLGLGLGFEIKKVFEQIYSIGWTCKSSLPKSSPARAFLVVSHQLCRQIELASKDR